MTARRDLHVVVSDGSIEAVVLALLTRRLDSLGLAGKLDFGQGDILALKGLKDGGTFLHGPTYLAQQRDQYRHGLILVDAAWDGSPGAVEMQRSLEGRLREHWQEDAAAVVIRPELEQWVFVDSPHLENLLGWNRDRDGTLRAWLNARGLWDVGASKPADPKRALETAMRRTGKRNNPGWLSMLASSGISLARCEDPSFLHFTGCLQRWFARQ